MTYQDLILDFELRARRCVPKLSLSARCVYKELIWISNCIANDNGQTGNLSLSIKWYITNISTDLGVTRNTVASALKELSGLGFIRYETFLGNRSGHTLFTLIPKPTIKRNDQSNAQTNDQSNAQKSNITQDYELNCASNDRSNDRSNTKSNAQNLSNPKDKDKDKDLNNSVEGSNEPFDGAKTFEKDSPNQQAEPQPEPKPKRKAKPKEPNPNQAVYDKAAKVFEELFAEWGGRGIRKADAKTIRLIHEEDKEPIDNIRKVYAWLKQRGKAVNGDGNFHIEVLGFNALRTKFEKIKGEMEKAGFKTEAEKQAQEKAKPTQADQLSEAEKLAKLQAQQLRALFKQPERQLRAASNFLQIDVLYYDISEERYLAERYPDPNRRPRPGIKDYWQYMAELERLGFDGNETI